MTRRDLETSLPKGASAKRLEERQRETCQKADSILQQHKGGGMKRGKKEERSSACEHSTPRQMKRV